MSEQSVDNLLTSREDEFMSGVSGRLQADSVDGILGRLAGAPISWGVCEVEDWGYQLPPEVVFAEMREAGLAAAEFGPTDYLPQDPAERSRFLELHRLRAVGGFLPVVLHDPNLDPLVTVGPAVSHIVASAGDHLVLAAATGLDGYDDRPELDEAAWQRLLTGLDEVRAYAAEHGVLVTLHPHAGTLVEGPADIERVLAGSTVDFCLDTGHLVVGGADPVEFARAAAERVAHVHLKDVDDGIARTVRTRTATYAEGVARGMYRPLGQGDAGIEQVLALLEAADYRGWYVLEQDRILAGPRDAGAPMRDVTASIEFLRRVSPTVDRARS